MKTKILFIILWLPISLFAQQEPDFCQEMVIKAEAALAAKAYENYLNRNSPPLVPLTNEEKKKYSID